MVDEGNFVANPRVDRVEALGEVLNNTLNSFIKLSESVSRQFNEINSRLMALENATTSDGSVILPASSIKTSAPRTLKPPPLSSTQKQLQIPKSKDVLKSTTEKFEKRLTENKPKRTTGTLTKS